MNEEQLKCLLDAATSAKLDPGSLKPVNPWTQKGATAQTLQMAVQQNFPQMAAQFRVEAGESVSLAAAAAKAGITQMNPQVEKELMELDSDFVVGQQEASARREAELLDQMAKGAADLAAQREAQQQSFARSSGNNSSGGGYNRDFLRRMGVQNATQLNNIPARRVAGK